MRLALSAPVYIARNARPRYRAGRLARSLSSAAAGQLHESRSALGMSVGVTVGAFTASMVAWPVADVAIAPIAIERAMCVPMERRADTSGCQASSSDVHRARLLSSDTLHARLSVLTGGKQQQCVALARKIAADRPVLWLSFRQAASPHSMQVVPLTAALTACLV